MNSALSHDDRLRLKNLVEKILLYGFYLCLFWFSYWLMFETFSFNEKDEILINGKIWSDFGATLPLIRSFSLGHNWPPEYPIFPGSAIQYHFVFQWLVAQLENVGFRIDWALNIPSIFGFFLMLLMTFKIASYLSNDKRVGLLSVAFFLLNGSLGFIQYFNKFGWTLASLVKIRNHSEYTAMGPWDGGEVIGFWHLNVFINQRHLCFALGLFMAFIWTCLEFQKFSKRQQWLLSVFFAIVGGFMIQIHKPVFLMWGITGLCFFVFMPAMRKHFVVMILLALPCIIMFPLMGLHLGVGSENPVQWFPGFYVHDHLSLKTFYEFWLWNWGLHLVLAPIGFFLASRQAQQVMLAPLLIFIIACTFRFTSDVLANHKFINFFMIMFQMLSALAVIKLYDNIRQCKTLAGFASIGGAMTVAIISRLTALVFVMPLLLILTLSGVIDLYAVDNGYFAGVKDLESNPTAKWINENTDPADVTLNSQFFYAPASVAGRKIFLGWAYFVVTAGYDFDSRKKVMAKIYRGEDPNVFCPLLKEHRITMMTVRDTSRDNNMVPVNYKYFYKNFKPDFQTVDRRVAIFRTSTLCDN